MADMPPQAFRCLRSHDATGSLSSRRQTAACCRDFPVDSEQRRTRRHVPREHPGRASGPRSAPASRPFAAHMGAVRRDRWVAVGSMVARRWEQRCSSDGGNALPQPLDGCLSGGHRSQPFVSSEVLCQVVEALRVDRLPVLLQARRARRNPVAGGQIFHG